MNLRQAQIIRLALLLNQRLTAAYSRFQNGESGFLQNELRDRFYLRGAEVAIQEGAARRIGRAVDLTPRGELVLETNAGKEIVRSGTVDSYHWTE